MIFCEIRQGWPGAAVSSGADFVTPTPMDCDSDFDGVADSNDAFPLIGLGGLTDTDHDGYPNDCDEECEAAGMTADLDDDNDGFTDEQEMADGTDPLSRFSCSQAVSALT